jgi:hypothetical protein
MSRKRRRMADQPQLDPVLARRLLYRLQRDGYITISESMDLLDDLPVSLKN